MATLQALGVTLSCGLGTKNNLKGILRRISYFHNVTEQLVEWKVRAIQQLTLSANVNSLASILGYLGFASQFTALLLFLVG